MHKVKCKAERNDLKKMTRMMAMDEDTMERMKEALVTKVKGQSGFALLVAMLMMVGVSLIMLRFALMS